MGRVFRIFQNHNINWGFFSDHDPYGPHCNAHMNNFVVLPKTFKQQGNFLAPLDFDLAFFKEHFVHLIQEDKDAYGLNHSRTFDEYMNNQRYPLECGISGAENMNFLYNTIDFGQKDGDTNIRDKYNLLLTLTRDWMVYGYRQGYENPDENLYQIDEGTKEASYLVIELALLLTHD